MFDGVVCFNLSAVWLLGGVYCWHLNLVFG